MRLEREVVVSATMRASGLADKMGEQGHKLEASACSSSKVGGSKMPQIKIQALVTKPD